MEKRGLMYAAGRQWGRMSTESRLYACLSAALIGAALFGAVVLSSAGRSKAPISAAATTPLAAAAPSAPASAPPARQPDLPKPKDPNAIPESWEEFRESARKDDKAIVAQIEKADWWKNCVSWGVEARKKVQSRKMWALQANLQASASINGVDLGGVRGKVPEIGMTTCGAFAVMGLPESVNRTKTVSGERVQFVWGSPRVYAYTQTSRGDANALVHSVQY